MVGCLAALPVNGSSPFACFVLPDLDDPFECTWRLCAEPFAEWSANFAQEPLDFRFMFAYLSEAALDGLARARHPLRPRFE